MTSHVSRGCRAWKSVLVVPQTSGHTDDEKNLLCRDLSCLSESEIYSIKLLQKIPNYTTKFEKLVSHSFKIESTVLILGYRYNL